MATKTETISPRYLELIRAFPLRRITDEAMLDRATEIAFQLDKRGGLTRDEEDYVHVLTGLIEEYEAAHHPIDDVSGPEVLRRLMEMNGVSQADVVEGTGLSKSTISEILSGKRAISRKHMEKLCPYFNVGPAVFLPKVKGIGEASCRPSS